MNLTGKVAIVTGAASGIGLATATLFLAEGASVIVSDLNETRLGEAATTFAGKAVVTFRANVAEQADCERMIAKAVDTFGRLDILVNNAGVMDLNQPVGRVDNEVWKRVMAVNVDGPMFAMRAAMPELLKSHGNIVNIASVAGVGGGAAGAAYTASKHAVIGLTLNTAFQYAKLGVRCNAVVVGGVTTHIMESVDATRMDQAGLARSGDYYPLMPAMLEPMDIARVVAFLASDNAARVNGALIPADAGWRAA